jgi:peptide/nickel transport system ATP-binding protein
VIAPHTTPRRAPAPREERAIEQGEPLLEIRNLTVEYVTARGTIRAVDDVTLDLKKGEVLGLCGESGCGKSTLAYAITRLLKPPAQIAGGQILFAGHDLTAMDADELRKFRWNRISIVFQSAMNALNPVISIGAQIADTLMAHTDMSKVEALERGAELLRTVGIERSRLKSYPHELSGGMRQRAVIAIALALNPDLIIMDEPTTALDVVVQQEILQQIEDLKERFGFSILFITHDLSLLIEMSTRIAVMYAGKIAELAPADELFRNPEHPYTVGLMNSFPSLTGPRRELTGIPGTPPHLLHPPSGCRFHPRCPHVMTVCAEVEPALAEANPGHLVACHLYPGS